MNIIENNIALKFLLAGDCTCVIESDKTGAKFTYSIKQAEDNENMFFIYLDRGYMDFIYAGFIVLNRENDGSKKFKFIKGKKGTITEEAVSAKALLYTLNSLINGKSCRGVNIYHLGTCGRCGRPLTDPESIRRGLGPTCASRS